MNLIIFSIVMISAGFSWADEFCSSERTFDHWYRERCKTAAAAAAGAGASKIYSMYKYSQAGSIEREHTKRIFDARSGSMSSDRTLVARASDSIRDGDRVTVSNQLNEQDNRAYHIQDLERQAAAARTEVIKLEKEAKEATQTRYRVDSTHSNGITTMTRVADGTEPDHVRRKEARAEAKVKAKFAEDLEKQANLARNNGPVPFHTLQKVITDNSGTAKATGDFTSQNLNANGKVVAIDKLPAAQVRTIANLAKVAGRGVLGATVGLGIVLEETLIGLAAENLRSRSSNTTIKMRERANQ